MPEQNGQEKTEQPTAKKLSDAREKGQTAKSQEINSLAIFSFGLIVLFVARESIGKSLSGLATFIFANLDGLELSYDLIGTYSFTAYFFFLKIMAPIFLVLVVVALAAGFGQVGLKLSLKAIQPKFSKMNPLKGIKEKFFSSRSMVEMLKSLFKLAILSVLTYSILKDIVSETTGLVSLSVIEIVEFMMESVISFVWKMAVAFALIAFSDFAFQKYKFKQDMMMTKQEVKEENKESEGSPEVKGKIRSQQIAMARNRMMKELPTADVVITNPTHFAVALRYDMDKDSAPKVIAKGQDLLAKKIKKIAAENNIPTHENRELARALYKICNVGDIIPDEFYHAVARILAFIFQERNNKKSRSIV